MTIKNATINDYRIASCDVNDTHGGQYLQINFTVDMIELVTWWQEWGPVFKSKDATVMDSLQHARTLHEMTK